MLGGGLQKLELIGYQDSSFSTPTNNNFCLPINPKSFRHNYEITYNSEETPGNSADVITFNKMGKETVELSDVYIDTTGAIPLPLEHIGKTTDDLIDELKDAVYTYIGAAHSPPYVQLVWGNFIFSCVLYSFNVEYQMFTPDGVPLRAKVDMSFRNYITPKDEAADADNQSPDVTHIVVIKHGDSLPALCYKVYKNTKYYLDVAQFNQLTDFRNLKVGDQLLFPPLKH